MNNTPSWFEPLLNTRPVIRKRFLTTDRYEQFKKEYTFESLKHGTRFGQAFCNYFDLTDHILFHKPSAESADQYIKKNYIKFNAKR